MGLKGEQTNTQILNNNWPILPVLNVRISVINFRFIPRRDLTNFRPLRGWLPVELPVGLSRNRLILLFSWNQHMIHFLHLVGIWRLCWKISTNFKGSKSSMGHFQIIFSLIFLGTKSKRIVALWTSSWLAIIISHCKMWRRFAPRITCLPTFISVTKNLERRKSAFVVKALQNYCFVRGFGSDWTRFEYRLSAPGRNNKFWLLIWDACSPHGSMNSEFSRVGAGLVCLCFKTNENSEIGNSRNYVVTAAQKHFWQY